jgi:hypothetical protein
MVKRAACKVVFDRDNRSAFLMSKSGYVLNAINYDPGHWPSKTEKIRDRRKLMRGCEELLRRHF